MTSRAHPCSRVGRRMALALVVAVVLGALPLLPALAEEGGGEQAPLAALDVAFVDGPASAQRGQAIRATPHDPSGPPVTVAVETVIDTDALADVAEAVRADLRAGLEQSFREEVARQLQEAREEPIGEEELEALVDAAIDQLEAVGGTSLEALLDEAVADNGEQDLGAELRAAVLAASDAASFDVHLAIASDAVGRTGTELEGTTTATATTVDGAGVASFDEPFSIDRTGRGFTLEAAAEETVTVAFTVTRAMAPPDLTTIGEACCVPEPGAGLTAEASGSHELDLAASSERSAPFIIWAVVHRCAPGVPCNASAQAQGFVVDVSAQEEAGALLLTPSHEDPGCGGDYQGLPQAVLLDTATGQGPKTVTITIERPVVHDTVDNGRSKYDICLLSDAPFRAKDGTLTERDDDLARYDGDPLVYGPALMANCKPRGGGQDPPCIGTRRAGAGGSAIFVLHLPEGDPMFR